MNIEDYYPLIDKALLGMLSNEEDRLFQKYLENEEFALEYELRKEIKFATKLEGRKDIKAQFEKLDTETRIRKMYPRRLWSAIAAAVILLIGVIFIIQLNTSPNNDLYASHYQRLENTMVSIQRGENDINELKKAFIAYNSQNYDEALILFNQLENKHPDIIMYKASIHMENGAFEDAIKILEPISQDIKAKYNTEAKWYLALSFIKLDNKAQAETLISELIAEGGFYGKKAALLLEDLHI